MMDEKKDVLFSKYLNGKLSDEEMGQLNEAIQSDPDFRKWFLNQTELEIGLHDYFSELEPSNVRTMARPAEVMSPWRRWKLPVVAAASLVLGFWLARSLDSGDGNVAGDKASIAIEDRQAGSHAHRNAQTGLGPLAGSGDFTHLDRGDHGQQPFQQIWLDELGGDHIRQGWGTAMVNRSVSDGPLKVGGTSYQRGIGTHAKSEAVYRLPFGVKSFTAMVGVSDEVRNKEWQGKEADCIFRVLGDGKELWNSALMKAGDDARRVSVSLVGVRELRLIVDPAEQGTSYDHANWMDAVFEYEGQAPQAQSWHADHSSYILTPPAGPAPKINGAKVIGCTPGKAFLFRIPTSGERPIQFRAEGLPASISLDAGKGILRGVVPAKGEYLIRLHARNPHGETQSELKLVSGDTLALTPPMGWNSWYCWSESVSAEKVSGIAQALVDKGLADYGWTYVNIDDCWQGERGGKYNAIQGNARFPDMKGLADDVHQHGLKLGIYSTPWMGSYAGFIGGTTNSENGRMPEKHVAPDKRIQPMQVYGRYPNVHRLELDSVGEYWFCDKDAKQWADWGIDLVKYDWKPNDVPTTKRLLKDLQNCGRDIVLSLSNDTPIANAKGISELSNLWRTGGDIHDHWGAILRNGFNKTEWLPYTRPGHWGDPDMLQVGMVGVPNRYVRKLKPTRLTPHEQYSHMSLWCLLSAPLLISCDVESMDAFTLSLLTNSEVIAVNQDPLGKAARPLAGNKEIWMKPLADGSYALGLFNLKDVSRELSVKSSDLKLSDGEWIVRDLWRQKDVGILADGVSRRVDAHGVSLLGIRRKP